MGVLYTVLPLTDDLTDYVAETGVELPRARGRLPEPVEVVHAVAAQEGFRGEERVSVFGWDLRVSGALDPSRQPRTLIHASDYVDHHTPVNIRFEKGWPSLILHIVRELSVVCGPLIVDPNTGCGPCLVQADSDIDELLATWGHSPSWLPGQTVGV